MDFNNVLISFLCLDRGRILAVYELSDFIKNILICVTKMNKGPTGLDRHEGEQSTELSFLGELTL